MAVICYTPVVVRSTPPRALSSYLLSSMILKKQEVELAYYYLSKVLTVYSCLETTTPRPGAIIVFHNAAVASSSSCLSCLIAPTNHYSILSTACSLVDVRRRTVVPVDLLLHRALASCRLLTYLLGSILTP